MPDKPTRETPRGEQPVGWGEGGGENYLMINWFKMFMNKSLWLDRLTDIWRDFTTSLWPIFSPTSYSRTGSFGTQLLAGAKCIHSSYEQFYICAKNLLNFNLDRSWHWELNPRRRTPFPNGEAISLGWRFLGWFYWNVTLLCLQSFNNKKRYKTDNMCSQNQITSSV